MVSSVKIRQSFHLASFERSRRLYFSYTSRVVREIRVKERLLLKLLHRPRWILSPCSRVQQKSFTFLLCRRKNLEFPRVCTIFLV